MRVGGLLLPPAARLDEIGPRLSFSNAVGIIPQVAIDAPPHPIQTCPQLVACILRRTPVSIAHGLDRHHLLMSVRTVVSRERGWRRSR